MPGTVRYLLDPFCGTGGILIEAELLSMHAIGSDFDPLMVQGSTRNLPSASLMIADATQLPFSDHSIDTIVTDFPYGQSVCIRKTDTMDQLYAASLEEIRQGAETRSPGRCCHAPGHLGNCSPGHDRFADARPACPQEPDPPGAGAGSLNLKYPGKEFFMPVSYQI